MRRAVAIQLVINRELGLNKTQNPWQGSFAIEYLTDLVEEAVYKEFESLSERGGVLGAMETMYQRGKIQEESLYYETKKHDGSLPIVGVNTFLRRTAIEDEIKGAALIRSTEEEKQAQVSAVRAYQQRNSQRSGDALSNAAAGGFVRRERVWGADGESEELLSGADFARAVSGGRAVSAEHVALLAARRLRASLSSRRPAPGQAPQAPQESPVATAHAAHGPPPQCVAAVATIGSRISTSIRAGCGQALLGGNAMRVPRTTTGTIGAARASSDGERPRMKLPEPRPFVERAFRKEHE